MLDDTHDIEDVLALFRSLLGLPQVAKPMWRVPSRSRMTPPERRCSCYFVSSSRAKPRRRCSCYDGSRASPTPSVVGGAVEGEHGPKPARLHSSHVDSLLDAAVGAGNPATAAEEKDWEAKMLREVIALIATRSRSDAALYAPSASHPRPSHPPLLLTASWVLECFHHMHGLPHPIPVLLSDTTGISQREPPLIASWRRSRRKYRRTIGFPFYCISVYRAP